MKIKKSKFAKLLSLALPIAAISVVAPVVLTSCGTTSSTDTPNNGGGSSGGGTSGDGGTNTPSTTVTAAWDTSKTQEGLTFNDSTKTATITLGDNVFGSTKISKASKYADIVSSLTPPNSSATKSEIVAQNETSDNGSKDDASSATSLYTVLSAAITNIDKYNVSIKIETNPITFDYTNDAIGNSFSGKFVLTPKDNKTATATELNFTVNNFNDSNNDSNKLTWNVEKIAEAFKNGTANTGNALPEVKPENDGASAVIKLPVENTLSQVMVELASTSISGDELKTFINNADETNYDVSKAQISNWAPTVDLSTVFTRIVIPSTDTAKQSAIMYIAYQGYTVDSGNAAWNKNIPYYDATNVSEDLWDKEYNEPVINLDETKLWDTGINSSSKASEIKEDKDKIAQYIAENYVLGYSKFTLDNSLGSFTEGAFNEDGKFVTPNAAESAQAKESSGKDVLTNNNNVIQIKFFLKITDFKTEPKGVDGNILKGYNETNKGFFKAFYITGYSTTADKT